MGDASDSIRLGRGNIWSLREDSGLHKNNADPLPITTGPLGYSSPTPALSGNRLFVIGEQQRAELQRFDLKSRQFVPFLNGLAGGEIDFSQDGQWMTYASYPDGFLWRSRTDGSQKLQLTSAPMDASMPRWSPTEDASRSCASFPEETQEFVSSPLTVVRRKKSSPMTRIGSMIRNGHRMGNR